MARYFFDLPRSQRSELKRTVEQASEVRDCGME